jgi:hypothetical protein
MKRFTMKDVEAAHAIKPYLPKIKILKNFAFLNRKIKQGWTEEGIVSYVGLCQSEHTTVKN